MDALDIFMLIGLTYVGLIFILLIITGVVLLVDAIRGDDV